MLREIRRKFRVLTAAWRHHHSLLKWVQFRLTRNQFIMISGIFVGITSGLAAVLLKSLVHFFNKIVTGSTDLDIHYLLLFAGPLVGLLLTAYIVKVFFKGKSGNGLGGVLQEIAQKAGMVSREKMYSQIITTTTTVGFGGSTGLEAPIAVTGAAIGSNYAKAYKVNKKDRTLLLAAGAAAGISAAFNAPITGLIFAIEVLLVDVSIAEFIPLIVASVSGALCSSIILHEDILFHFGNAKEFDFHNVPFYLLLGVFCGFVSIYYARLRHSIDEAFARFNSRVYVKALLGGILLSGLCVAFPSLFGEGYQSIKLLAEENPLKLFENTFLLDYALNPWFVLCFIGLVGIVKALATSITISSGGNGGNFAPSLFVGGYFGFFFSSLINQLRISTLPISNFTIVGMAGVLSGVMYAPLTAIFLIAEITGGYELIIPLMMVSALSFFITKHFEPVSPELKKLVEKGEVLTADKDRNILTLIKTYQVVERDYPVIYPHQNLQHLVEVVKSSNVSIFPVVDKHNAFLGILTLGDLKEVMFQPELYQKMQASQLMRKAPVTVNINEDMASAIRKFEKTEYTQLPVVDGFTYVGFISKSTIFNYYRQELIHQSGMQ